MQPDARSPTRVYEPEHKAINARQVANAHDSVSWALENKGMYTTKSMYIMLVFRGCRAKEQRNFGSAKFP